MTTFYDVILNEESIPTLKKSNVINSNNQSVSIEEIVNILNAYEYIDQLASERSYAVALDNNFNIIGINLISIGDSKNCYMYKKQIITFALLAGAEHILLFHNHPSNILEASENDISSFYSLYQLTTLLNIDLVDSVIVCKNGWLCIKSGEGEEYDEEFESEKNII